MAHNQESKDLEKVIGFVPIDISYWSNKKGHKHIHQRVFVGEDALERCKKYFDERHDCSNKPHISCDYCKADWKEKHSVWQRDVDHDGAFVEYICYPVSVNDK